MPDFERVIDQLRLDLAKSPVEIARAEGFIAGKRYARKQVAFVAACAAAIAVLLAAWVAERLL